MHTHGNSINVSPTDFYSANTGERAAADRAAAVRRRLLKTAASLDTNEPDDETLLVNHWLNASSGHSEDDPK